MTKSNEIGGFLISLLTVAAAIVTLITFDESDFLPKFSSRFGIGDETPRVAAMTLSISHVEVGETGAKSISKAGGGKMLVLLLDSEKSPGESDLVTCEKRPMSATQPLPQEKKDSNEAPIWAWFDGEKGDTMIGREQIIERNGILEKQSNLNLKYRNILGVSNGDEWWNCKFEGEAPDTIVMNSEYSMSNKLSQLFSVFIFSLVGVVAVVLFMYIKTRKPGNNKGTAHAEESSPGTPAKAE